MRLMDIVLTMPSLLLADRAGGDPGPGLTNAMIAVAITYLPYFVRITRAAVIGEMSKDYVTASRVNGAGPLRLMFLTVLPNCMAPLIVQATLSFSTAILDAAALGFLGLGAQPPTPEWGTMLADARDFILRAWWVVTLPGHRHPGHGAGVQPDGRRAARCSRPAAETLMALLEIEDLYVTFATARGRLRAVDGVSLSIEPRRSARHCRRVGLGQERLDAGGDGSGRPSWARSAARRLHFAGRDLLHHERARAAPPRRARTSR